jgi:type III polyketide synthase
MRSLLSVERPSFEVLKTHVETLPNSEAELSYNVHPTGWRATVTPKVPLIVASALPPLVRAFLPRRNTAPATYDWYAYIFTKTRSSPYVSLRFIHPGGAAILAAVEKGLGLNAADHMLASWEVYENRGNMV